MTTNLTIEHALLGFVAEQPSYGYEIYQQLSTPSELWQVWRMKQSQLYALLTKLEDAGYLAATLQAQEARPPRKVYALTEQGRKVYTRWLTMPVPHGRQMRLEFLTKLYFAHRQHPDHLHTLIAEQSSVCQQWLAELQAQAADSVAPPFFSFAVQQFRLQQIESFLAWLATCQQALAVEVEKETRR
ncbi:MAG: helix-turn-helix transcriptional regulator [Caldilineaceae bacterium]